MKEIEFKEVDLIGEETLAVISTANAFNQWTYQRVQPFCQGKILEIGSGVGNISHYFLEAGYPLHLSDVRPHYCQALEKRFSKTPNCQGITHLDWVAPDFKERYADLLGQFDTIFSLNVLEHIHQDALAIQHAKLLLRPKGRLLILVPSYQWLYNQLDKNLDHYRRYTTRSLGQLIEAQGFRLLHRQYFNFMGIFAWFISGYLQGNRQIPAGQMRLYNTFVPFFKLLDRLVFKSMGLSTIVVAELE
ncbi:MAG: class I SAM-dependent methyltransferase [Aureispira sp.]